MLKIYQKAKHEGSLSDGHAAAMKELHAMHYRLRHPNIMAITDFVEQDRLAVLVMDQMIDDLRNALFHCFQHGRHSLEESFAKKIFIQMLQAVDHCHR